MLEINRELRYIGARLLRDNFVCDRMIAKLRSHERYTAEELRSISRRLLMRTLRAATRKIPFYRDIKIDASDKEAESILVNAFPIITKHDLLSKKGVLYPNRGKAWPWTIIGETGGTTGSPVRLLRSYQSIVWQNAFIKRQWSWVGFRDGMARAILRGDMVVPVEKKEPPFWHVNRFHNQLCLSTVHLREETADLFADALQRFQPFMIEAYPSAAYDLARYLAIRNRYLNIPYVFTASEPLYPHQREIIEKRFQARVMDQYGMGERVTFATECEYGNLHVNTEHSYTEIVDDKGEPTDDYGFVVGTTFNNLLMPLVRYQLTDQTKWKRGSCACNRTYPMIERVSGRIEDIILGTHGNDIGPLLFRVHHEVDGIESIQIAQVGRHELEIRVVPLGSFSQDSRQRLIQNLHHYVDPGLAVKVVTMDYIPRTRRGKFRWIVNEYVDGDRESRKAPSLTR